MVRHALHTAAAFATVINSPPTSSPAVDPVVSAAEENSTSVNRSSRPRWPSAGLECYDLGDHPRSWYRGKELVALTYEPYNGHSATRAGQFTQAVAVDAPEVSVCACCAVHFPAMSTAVDITHAEEPHDHL